MFTPQLLISLLIILVAAWITGNLFVRIGLPFVLGELVAGVLIGPAVLGIVAPSPAIELLAELGIFFVMFHTGMEMDPKELLEHIWPSLAVAAGGFILPFVLGYFITKAFGGTLYQSLFVGMGVSITAIAVQSVILHSMKISSTYIGHIIIGAAIADDILSLIGLSVLLSLVKTGSIHMTEISFTIIKIVGFFSVTIILGHFVVPKITRKLHDREGNAFTFAMIAALTMAYLAELVGLHLIIGAFLAGQYVRKEIMDVKIYSAIQDRFYGISYGFLVPVFFASLSFHLHFSWNISFILFSLVLTLIAIIGKVVGCGAGYAIIRRNFWESAIIGFGMNGRGAVEIVVASVVLKLSGELMSSNVISEPLLTQDQFSALIFMAFITTLLAPITLKWSITKACSADENKSFCMLWDSSRKQ
jgi:Kef-type K+ transport system membrane component KefB